MASPSPVPIGDPIARNDDETPVLYPALGAVFHLELLERDDEARLDAVNDLVWDWIGPYLRFVDRTFEPDVARVRRADADYISGYAAGLDVTGSTDPTEQAALELHAQFSHDDFDVSFCGGPTPTAASPYSYRFWAEVPDPPSGRVSSYATMHVTVPEAWPLDDFRQRVLAIASKLRLRWGAAGHTYSPWLVSGYEVAGAHLYGHARRFLGYDTAEYMRLVKPFYRRIRTVNWLTFLGPAFVGELAEHGTNLQSGPLVAVDALGAGVVLQAGAQPERGDRNRLQHPSAYVEVDALLRPIRADKGEGMVFLGDWSEEDITEWLRRFERRVS
jgi:hypothetical protein